MRSIEGYPYDVDDRRRWLRKQNNRITVELGGDGVHEERSFFDALPTFTKQVNQPATRVYLGNYRQCPYVRAGQGRKSGLDHRRSGDGGEECPVLCPHIRLHCSFSAVVCLETYALGKKVKLPINIQGIQEAARQQAGS